MARQKRNSRKIILLAHHDPVYYMVLKEFLKDLKVGVKILFTPTKAATLKKFNATWNKLDLVILNFFLQDLCSPYDVFKDICRAIKDYNHKKEIKPCIIFGPDEDEIWEIRQKLLGASHTFVSSRGIHLSMDRVIPAILVALGYKKIKDHYYLTPTDALTLKKLEPTLDNLRRLGVKPIITESL